MPPIAGRRIDWQAAALLGLITSTFSTIVAQLLAARQGRDALVDWMIVASIPLQDMALMAEPNGPVIAAGILFHQSADFLWALFFFGLLGRWTAGLAPITIALVAPVWAAATSAIEYFVIVPVWQPVFTLTQPYWIGLLVHLASASLYPLFPWLRDRLAGVSPSQHRRFGLRWSAAAALGLLPVALVALASQHREWPPRLGSAATAAFDSTFMRRMAAHHRQGIALAQLAADHAIAPHLRALARLMAAEQAGDIAILSHWHHSWFGAAGPPDPGPEAQAAMPGMLSQAQVADLATSAAQPGFDDRFAAAMTFHHFGAVVMADQELHQGGDPRLRLMAHAIRHGQRGEIALMHGIPRGPAVAMAAFHNMLAPVTAPPPRHNPQASAPAVPSR